MIKKTGMADVQTPVRLEFFYGKPTEDPFQWLESFELFLEINHVVGDRVLRFVIRQCVKKHIPGFVQIKMTLVTGMNARRLFSKDVASTRTPLW